jgi:rhodanese-related sulfurtransferase
VTGSLLALLLLVGWEAAWWAAGIRPLLPGKLKTLEAGEGSSRLLIVDVRTALEYRWAHIPGAVSQPDLLFHPDALSREPRQTHLVLICLSGHRAPVAAWRMKRLGFEQVSYLSWGMLAWMASGGETVAGRGGL